ncbi:IS4 family transposase [candidate division FCPU426 bacterium]|nr:IS4 family transposase [candidate division FCPU426 bacterium]
MAHCPTILSQMLKLFSRYDFEKLVSKHHAEFHARGVRSWSQCVALLFGQLAGQDSLRGIEAGLATQGRNLYRLGVTPMSRSSLAYANAHRPAALFEDLFYRMLSKCTAIAPRHKFRFKNPLYSIDASLIRLCLSLFDWAKFRKTKGAIKLHVKFNHAGYIPNFALLTTGKVHESQIAPKIPLDSGDVVVMDRGYLDYGYLQTLENKGVFFVTRLKSNSRFRIVERKPHSQPNICADQTIEFTGFYTRQNYCGPLRRVVAKDPETKKRVVLLTNQFDWSPATIAAIYKDRWQIEIFFKTLKQQLKVKSFVGTSENALLSQLWTALIAYLLLSYLKFTSKFQWSLYTLSSIVPTNLFSRRDLWDWLNNPYKVSAGPNWALKQTRFRFA